MVLLLIIHPRSWAKSEKFRFVPEGAARSSQTTTDRNNMEQPLKTNKDENVLDVLVLILVKNWHRFVSMMKVLTINLEQQLACDVSWCLLCPLLYHYFASAPPNCHPWTNGTSSSKWSDGELFNNSWEESITPVRVPRSSAKKKSKNKNMARVGSIRRLLFFWGGGGGEGFLQERKQWQWRPFSGEKSRCNSKQLRVMTLAWLKWRQGTSTAVFFQVDWSLAAGTS